MVLLLHAGDPRQLALLDEGLDVLGADGVAADSLLVLEHEAVVRAQTQDPAHQPVGGRSGDNSDRTDAPRTKLPLRATGIHHYATEKHVYSSA